LLTHLGFDAVHLIETGEKLRFARRVLLETLHPACSQISRPGIGDRNVILQQAFRLLNQSGPDICQRLFVLCKRQLL